LLARFAATIGVFAYDQAARERYGRMVEAKAFSRRHVIDRMTAAHAFNLGGTLGTNNNADFAEIDGLRLENWVP
jgi:tRNA(fMet)-specific endonuclease VapC